MAWKLWCIRPITWDSLVQESRQIPCGNKISEVIVTFWQCIYLLLFDAYRTPSAYRWQLDCFPPKIPVLSKSCQSSPMFPRKSESRCQCPWGNICSPCLWSSRVSPFVWKLHLFPKRISTAQLLEEPSCAPHHAQGRGAHHKEQQCNWHHSYPWNRWDPHPWHAWQHHVPKQWMHGLGPRLCQVRVNVNVQVWRRFPWTHQVRFRGTQVWYTYGTALISSVRCKIYAAICIFQGGAPRPPTQFCDSQLVSCCPV